MRQLAYSVATMPPSRSTSMSQGAMRPKAMRSRGSTRGVKGAGGNGKSSTAPLVGSRRPSREPTQAPVTLLQALHSFHADYYTKYAIGGPVEDRPEQWVNLLAVHVLGDGLTIVSH